MNTLINPFEPVFIDGYVPSLDEHLTTGGSVNSYVARYLQNQNSADTRSNPNYNKIIDQLSSGDYRLEQPGRCLEFNATDQYVACPDFGIDIDRDFSFITWVYLDTAAATNQNVLSLSDGTGTGRTMIYYHGSTERWATFFGGTGTLPLSNFKPSTSTWHCICISFDSSAEEMTFFENGTVRNTQSITPEACDGGPVLGSTKAFGDVLDGKLWRPMWFERALTVAEYNEIRSEVETNRHRLEDLANNLKADHLWDTESGSIIRVPDCGTSTTRHMHGKIGNYASGFNFEASAEADVPSSRQNLEGWHDLAGLYFDGVDDFAEDVRTPADQSFFDDGSFTMAADFIYLGDGTIWHVGADNSNLYASIIVTSGEVRFQTRDNNLSPSVDADETGEILTVGQRYRIVCVYHSATDRKVYINSTTPYEFTDSRAFSSTGVVWVCNACRRGGSDDNFAEAIMLHGIFETAEAWTDSQIAEYMADGAIRTVPTGVDPYWDVKFLDGSGSDATSDDSVGRDLSITGATWVTERIGRDLSNTTKSADGLDLTYTGTVPFDFELQDAPCVTMTSASSHRINTGLDFSDGNSPQLPGVRCKHRVIFRGDASGILTSQGGFASGVNAGGFYIQPTNFNIKLNGGQVINYKHNQTLDANTWYDIVWDVTIPPHDTASGDILANFVLHSLTINGVDYTSETVQNNTPNNFFYYGSGSFLYNWAIGARDVNTGTHDGPDLEGRIAFASIQRVSDGEYLAYVPMVHGAGNKFWNLADGSSFDMANYNVSIWNNTQSFYFGTYELGHTKATHSSLETIEIPLNLDGTSNTTDESGYTNGTTQYPAYRINSEHLTVEPRPEPGSPNLQDFDLPTIVGWQDSLGGIITFVNDSLGWADAAIVLSDYFTNNFDPVYWMNDIQLWLDATDTDTVTVDVGVSEWADKSNYGRDATQSTDADQLDYTSGEYIESHGPGENEHLDIASDLNTTAGGEFTILTRMKTLSGDGTNSAMLISGGNGADQDGHMIATNNFTGDAPNYRHINATSLAQWANGSSISTSAEDNIDLNVWYNLATTGEVIDVDGGNHVLFMADNETSKANLQLAEIIVFNRTLTEAQILAANDWMDAKHGA